jgi:hypothetical protein
LQAWRNGVSNGEVEEDLNRRKRQMAGILYLGKKLKFDFSHALAIEFTDVGEAVKRVFGFAGR